jgi:hypothetical protein
MPFTYKPTSTLSAAITDSDNAFNVASTANISVGSLLAFRQELMQVRNIPVSGRVVVRRGYEGTHALAHKSGATFFIGSGSDFEGIYNQTLGLFGPAAMLPKICIPGARAFDADGYEYVLVDIGAITNAVGIVSGSTVGISKDGLYTATTLSTSHSGPIGIITETATSNQWVWALIRGLYVAAEVSLGSSAATSTGVCLPASSVSSPSVGLLVVTTSQASSIYATTSAGIGEYPVIHGMWPASTVSSTGPTASSVDHTGLQIDVWLNYPYMDRKLSS